MKTTKQTSRTAVARFVLKEPTSDKPTPIYLLYRYQNDRLKYSTGQTITPALWDANQQYARIDQPTPKDREPFVSLNARLSRYRAALTQITSRCQLANIEPTVEEVRAQLNKEFATDKTRKQATTGRTTAPVAVGFFEYCEGFLSDCKAGKRLTQTNRQYSVSVLKSFRTTVNHLIKFGSTYKAISKFDGFTMEFYHRFKMHLTNQNYTLNTIGKIIKNVKILLKEGYRDGVHTNTIFRHEDFKKMAEEVDNIYLTDHELQRLYDLDLTDNPRLATVRDAFLIGCYTGLRFSDFMQIHPHNLTNDGRLLTIHTQKTGAKVAVPLTSNALAILERHGYKTPKVLSNQKFNAYLKELAQRADLTELVQTTRTQGGHRVTTTRPKWELVTTHTARRSFATNAYKGGVSTVDIMKMTGHKTETSFMRYIKVTAEDTGLRMLAHPHFSGIAADVATVRPLHKVA